MQQQQRTGLLDSTQQREAKDAAVLLRIGDNTTPARMAIASSNKKQMKYVFISGMLLVFLAVVGAVLGGTYEAGIWGNKSSSTTSSTQQLRPSSMPSRTPTTVTPSSNPSRAPTTPTTPHPSSAPTTTQPSAIPTTSQPSIVPSSSPSMTPSTVPSRAPSISVVGTFSTTLYKVDDTDTGMLVGRNLTATKQFASTGIRVIWYDNFGVSTNEGNCVWEFYFNGQPCTNPGRTHFNKNEGFTNSDRHDPATVVKVCFGTATGPLPTGQVVVQAHVASGSVNANCHTGYSSTQTYIEAAEINPHPSRAVSYQEVQIPAGGLQGRNVNIYKYEQSTGIQVMWSDNFVTPGDNKICEWELYFNGLPCTNPGRVYHYKNEGFANPFSFRYDPTTIVGLCFGTSAGLLPPGQVTVQAVSNSLSNHICITGFIDAQSYMEAFEVVSAYGSARKVIYNEGTSIGGPVLISGRDVTISKQEASSGIRVTWTDNLGTSNFGSCLWELYFNGLPCADPGRIIAEKPEGKSGAQFTDPMTLFGICYGNSNGALAVGDVVVQVYVQKTGFDQLCGTGFRSQVYLLAEEVALSS